MTFSVWLNMNNGDVPLRGHKRSGQGSCRLFHNIISVCGKAAGIKGWIVKPFNGANVLDAVKKMVGQLLFKKARVLSLDKLSKKGVTKQGQ